MSFKRLVPLSFKLLFILLIAVLWTSCASTYVTPGAGINIDKIEDQSIKERFEIKPASPFPVGLAVARIQQSGYYSHGNQSYGEGSFSVVMERDIEMEEHFEKLKSLEDVVNITIMNQVLIPSSLTGIKDLRKAAASMHADMLFVYTIDTSFNIKGQSFGPLSKISLGFLPNQEATVTTIASAVVYDVRTGYIYATVEQAYKTNHKASIWSTSQAIDSARLRTEREAFNQLINAFPDVWAGILKEYKK